jgi:ATP synthase protein I
VKPDPENVRKWGELAGIGPLLVAAVLVGWALGTWADGKLGTEPWGLVIGVLLGTVAGFVQLVKLLNRVGEGGRRDRGRKP